MSSWSGSWGRGRKGTRPSLAERIVRSGHSSKPDQHLSTLQGQLNSSIRGNPTLERAIEILQGMKADPSKQGPSYRASYSSFERKPYDPYKHY